jgi:hypothetical protein
MSLFNLNFFRVVFCVALLTACNSSTAEKKNNIPTNKSVGDGAGISQQSVNNEPIELSGLKIKYKKYSAEKCLDPIPSEDEEDEFQETEPFCARREVTLMRVYLTDNNISDKINAAILKSVTNQDKGALNINSFVDEVYEEEDYNEACEEEITCEALDFNETFLSISITSYIYMNGAAHPSNQVQIQNFDLQTGEIINMRDLFNTGYKEKLKRIVEREFINEHGYESWDFTPRNGSFKLSENFSIGKKGLSFVYNEYEIGCYAAGAPELTINWKDLRPLMKENPYIELE